VIITYTLTSGNVAAVGFSAAPGDLFLSGLLLLATGLIVLKIIVGLTNDNSNR
jgi:hypothetical protein